MTTSRPAPIPNSYWVTEHLIAGEYPGSLGEGEGTDKLAALLDAGVRTFIDLTEEEELAAYEPLLQVLAKERQIEVEHVRLSIRDMRVPPPKRMRAILDAIERSASAGRLVYVHCWGGVGRTGTVVGCLLVRCGRSGDEALAEVARLFRTMSAAKLRNHPDGSPESVAQKTMIRYWKEEESREQA